jgi:hypothetical protein
VIGLLLSLVIQLVVFAVQLVIMIVIWSFRLAAMAIAAIFAFIASERAKRAPLPPGRQPMDPDLRWTVFRRDGYACVWCGSDSDLTIDHIHPVALGGTNDVSNLQTLCRTCNSRKGISASPGRYRRRELQRVR